MEKKDLSQSPPPGSLVPYYIQNVDEDDVVLEPWCFNDFTKWGSYSKLAAQASESDAFHLNDDAEDKSHKIPARYIQHFELTQINSKESS